MSIDHQRSKALVLSILLNGLVIYLWISGLSREKIYENLRIFSNISLRVLLENLIVIAIVAGNCFALIKLHPVFSWSWMSLLHKGPHMNVFLIPLQLRYVRLLFLLLVFIQLPGVALQEERWFRLGTTNWFDAAPRSLLFGMAHCMVGVPLGVGIALIIPGLWFSYQYFVGGIEHSTLHHTSYNTIVFTVVFLVMLKGDIEMIARRLFSRSDVAANNT